MVVTELQGGLGNQMFQYAIGRHLSILNNCRLLLDTRYLDDRKPRKNFTYRELNLDIFNIDIELAPESISRKYGLNRNFFWKFISRLPLPKKLRVINEERFSFSPEVLHSPDNVYLKGYWQTEKYFTAIEDIIRTDFVLKKSLPPVIQKLQYEISSAMSVCMHVRRGDFVHTDMHRTLGMEYYGKAATLMQAKFEAVVFYVFSDDIEWCKKNIVFNGRIIYVDDSFAGEKSSGHFSLMCSCRHFIIPNSSFAWWAAWLGADKNKVVVAPRTWFYNEKWDTKDILPADWIKL